MSFSNHDQWLQHDASDWRHAATVIDGCLASSIETETRPAWCCVCDGVTEMDLSWATSAIAHTGALVPDWHGAVICRDCAVPSSARAACQLLLDRPGHSLPIAVEGMHDEAVAAISWRLASAVRVDGADEVPPGNVMSCDVIDLARDWREHLSGLRSLVSGDGRLVMTTKRFDPACAATEDAPRRFGWDLISAVRDAPFTRVVAHHYWAPWQGHLGTGSFVFEAIP
jgi:hypothetical protein